MNSTPSQPVYPCKFIRDSHEWRFLKGIMRRNPLSRQEGAYELEYNALVAKRERELPLEVISSIGG